MEKRWDVDMKTGRLYVGDGKDYNKLIRFLTNPKDIPRVLPKIIMRCPNCGEMHLALFRNTAQCRACGGIHLINTEKVWGIHAST